MATPETSVLDVKIEEGVAIVTLNRPEAMNAFNMRLRGELVRAVGELDANEEVGAMVFTGAGDKAFCAGADLKERGARTTDQLYHDRRFARARSVSAIASLVKPTIAAINGYCLGGGLEMALQCDLRIASENARFGLPEVTLGFLPGGGATQRLPRAIGLQKAKELILTGRRFGAQEAYELGLLLRVVPHEKLMPEALGLAKAIVANPRRSVIQAKLAMNATQETLLSAGLQVENEAWLGCMLSDVWKSRVQNFKDKQG